MIGGLDLSNPKKKYNYRGFEISPSSYWLEDFFIDLSGSLENEEGKKDIKKINKLLNLTIL